MTWLVPKLRNRVQIMLPYQVPNSVGGADLEFRRIATVWAGLKKVSHRHAMDHYIRGERLADSGSHTFEIRKQAVSGIHSPLFGQGYGAGYTVDPGGFGREYDQGFGSGFDSIIDAAPIKSDMYMFLLINGRQDRGRLFKIIGAQDVGERREYYKITVTEIEERGTGYSA